MPLDHHPTPPLPLDSRGHLLEKLLGGPLENKKKTACQFSRQKVFLTSHIFHLL